MEAGAGDHDDDDQSGMKSSRRWRESDGPELERGEGELGGKGG